jgi:hypothetical protein
VITNDKDFGEKVYRERRLHKGTVLLRLEDKRAAKKIAALQRLLECYAEQLANWSCDEKAGSFCAYR